MTIGSLEHRGSAIWTRPDWHFSRGRRCWRTTNCCAAASIAWTRLDGIEVPGRIAGGLGFTMPRPQVSMVPQKTLRFRGIVLWGPFLRSMLICRKEMNHPRALSTPPPQKKGSFILQLSLPKTARPSCSQTLNIPRRALLAYPDSLKLMSLKNGSSDSAPRPLVQAPFVGTRLGFPD